MLKTLFHLKLTYILTKTINQTNEHLTNYQGGGNMFHNYSSAKTNLKNHSRRWIHAQPDLEKQCLICDSKFTVKYILPKQQYSLKNNWGYWTDKENNKQKYLCNSCLWKLHVGKMSDWIENESRADVFYNYIKRGQFGKKEF